MVSKSGALSESDESDESEEPDDESLDCDSRACSISLLRSTLIVAVTEVLTSPVSRALSAALRIANPMVGDNRHDQHDENIAALIPYYRFPGVVEHEHDASLGPVQDGLIDT